MRSDILQRITAVKTEISNYEAKMVSLRKEVQQLEKEIESRKLVMEMIDRPWSGGGKLADARRRLAQLELDLMDCDAAPVYFVGEEEPSATYVLEKLTEKRIYIRRRGGKSVTLYSRYDGTSVRMYGRQVLDLERMKIEPTATGA